jgi:hypothetical protein
MQDWNFIEKLVQEKVNNFKLQGKSITDENVDAILWSYWQNLDQGLGGV